MKASTKVGEIEWAEVLNYRKASGHERGLLINYGAKSLERTRFIRPTTARKETETKNLRNLRNLRIFPNSLPFNDCSSFSWSTH